MRQELLEKYLCGKKKKKKIDEQSGDNQGQGSTELWFGSWSRPHIIYVRNEEILFSQCPHYPTGARMTEEDRDVVREWGYIVLDW